jgi:exodeoxyribonuclease V alpha subunit
MKADPFFPSFLRDLFPKAGPDLLRLFEAAAENSNLLRVDFYTVRDLVELSGYTTQEALQALLLVMFLALDEGSLCVEASPASLHRRLQDLAGEAAAGAWAQRIVAELCQPGFPTLIGQRVDEGKPVVLRQVGAKTYLYFQKYLKHELALQAELRRRLGSSRTGPSGGPRFPTAGPRAWAGAPGSAMLNEVLRERPLLLGGRPLQLNREQRLALGLSLLRDFVIVSGGPGTGKTSIVFTLLRCLVRCGISAERIALAAPTGRAAQRLTDAVRDGLENLSPPIDPGGADITLGNLAARTLHQLLGYHPSRDTYRHHAENPLPHDVVIVDEVSMVGLVLMARLLQALDAGTRLILLGDKDQLPSVDAGAVLANLAPSGRRPVYSVKTCGQLRELWSDLELPVGDGRDPLQDILVVLEENYRSERRIHELARAVNAQRSGIVEQLSRLSFPRPAAKEAAFEGAYFAELDRQGGCWLVEQGQTDVGQWRQVLEQWAHHYYLAALPDGKSYGDLVVDCKNLAAEKMRIEEKHALNRLFLLLARARVLTLVREGPWGSVGINSYLGQVLRPKLDPSSHGRIFAGLPVMITRNDYNRALFNGDVGIALGGQAGYRVFFQRSGDYVSFPADALPAHEPAFAITVHKSQGSEYGQVLLVLPPEGGRRLLSKEMIYTGITRAKHLVAICSKAQVLRYAVSRKVERESALLDGL